MMPQLVDLAGDADGDVRIAAVETAVKLMNFLDAESLRDTVVPMVVEAGDRARSDAEDDVLAKMAHFQVSGTLLPSNQFKQVHVNTPQSRFLSVVLDGVMGPPYLIAQYT